MVGEGVMWCDDLLKEIFYRVSVKSVMRFKAVCRHWLSLLSDMEFICTHALRRDGEPILGIIMRLP